MSSSDEWNPHEKKPNRARKRALKRKSEKQLQKGSSKKFVETNVDVSKPSCSGYQSNKAAASTKSRKRPYSITTSSKKVPGASPVGFRKVSLQLDFDRPKEKPAQDPKLKGINIKHYLNFDSPVLEKFKEKKKDPEFLRLVARGTTAIRLSSDEDDSKEKSKDDGGVDTSRDELFRNLLPSDSDEEYRSWAKVAGRKSITRTRYSGKPLPDENLLPNYDGVFETSSPSTSHPTVEKSVDAGQSSKKKEKSGDSNADL